MKRWSLFLISLLFCLGTLNVLNHRMGMIPALGPALDPFHGLWAANEIHWPWIRRSKLVWHSPEVHEEIKIQYDSNHIPHIFAKQDEDLFFAQGWVTARDRLWQMDFQARVGMGRLSEIVGSQGLRRDRLFVRLQFPEIALKSLEEIRQNPESWNALQAYTRGVNSYINSLKPKDYPFEFKLMDYKPEPWTPLKSIIIGKLMTFRLAGMSSDFRMSRSLALYNEKVMDDLFPYFPFNNKPTVHEKMHLSTNVSIPRVPALFHPDKRDLGLQALLEELPKTQLGDGSNSWAVAGTKTASGFPMLANDTHLNYSLPLIWYQIQLVSPTMNVYGVSIPGTPTVLFGFNSKVAWSATNGYDDVMDWYDIRFKDEQKNEYWYKNQWTRTTKSTAIIKIRDSSPDEETIIRTVQGPILYEKGMTPLSNDHPVGMAVRWIGDEASNPIENFLKLDRAQSVQDCESALKTFVAPSQNFTCIDSTGNLEYLHQGKIPLKWKGQGRYVSDGSDPAYDWHGWIPQEDLPHVLNPSSGYVFSANQHPIDESYPYYLNWDYPESYRAARIDQLLKNAQHLKMDDFEKMQSDVYDPLAAQVLPPLLKAVKTQTLADADKQWIGILDKWDFTRNLDSVAATIFESWWETLYTAIWRPHFGSEEHFAWPPVSRTVQLILESPNSQWFESPKDGGHTSLAALGIETLRAGVQSLRKKLGDNSNEWQWRRYLHNEIPHLARVPGLGTYFDMGGSVNTINANFGEHGPVWRLVVEMGPKVHARAIMPGGESGNPGSKKYNEYTADWSQGKLRDVVFLETPAAGNDPQIESTLEIERQ